MSKKSSKNHFFIDVVLEELKSTPLFKVYESHGLDVLDMVLALVNSGTIDIQLKNFLSDHLLSTRS